MTKHTSEPFPGKGCLWGRSIRCLSPWDRKGWGIPEQCVLWSWEADFFVQLSPSSLPSPSVTPNTVKPMFRVINHTQMCFINGSDTSKSNQVGNQDQRQRNSSLHLNKEKACLKCQSARFSPICLRHPRVQWTMVVYLCYDPQFVYRPLMVKSMDRNGKWESALSFFAKRMKCHLILDHLPHQNQVISLLPNPSFIPLFSCPWFAWPPFTQSSGSSPFFSCIPLPSLPLLPPHGRYIPFWAGMLYIINSKWLKTTNTHIVFKVRGLEKWWHKRSF